MAIIEKTKRLLGTLGRGVGAITGRNIEVAAEKLAEIHGEILLGMERRLDSLERRVDAVSDLATLRQRLEDVERRLDTERRELRHARILAVAAVVFGAFALLAAVISMVGRW